MGEVDGCREWLSGWCTGCGLDIGHGGNLIVPWAIGLDRPEGYPHRAHCGNFPTHLTHDASALPFKDGMLDFVFSSHCLEDFEDTTAILNEWLRVIRRGGYLVLFLPDQKRYDAHCKRNGALPNQDHKHKDFGMNFVAHKLDGVNTTWEFSHIKDPVEYNPYSFELVIKKL
jgi:predicted SAM-dependent methyltransferase